MHRLTLHDKTLSLAHNYIKDGGTIQELASAACVTYQRVWFWLNKQDLKAARLNVDAVQRLYEHLTGKELEY